jgi:hypothetical protein
MSTTTETLAAHAVSHIIREQHHPRACPEDSAQESTHNGRVSGARVLVLGGRDGEERAA